jgi:hypothetical protein
MKQQEGGDTYVMRSFKICSIQQILLVCSRTTRWTGHVARMREKKNAYKVLIGNSATRRPLGKPRRKWDYTKMDCQGIRWDGVDGIHLDGGTVQWRALVNTLMNLRMLRIS